MSPRRECPKNASVEHGGKPYCGQHDPVKAAARRAKIAAASNAALDNRLRERALAAACERVGRADYAVRRLDGKSYSDRLSCGPSARAELEAAREALDALHRQGEG